MLQRRDATEDEPRAEAKRKHHEVVDLTADEEVDQIVKRARACGNKGGRDNQASNGMDSKITTPNDDGDCDDDDDSGEDSASEYEEILDDFERDPYTPYSEQPGLSGEITSSLHRHLIKVGPVAFIKEVLGVVYAPRTLGTAFGLPPSLFPNDEDKYLKLLGRAITRASQKRQKLPQYNTINDVANLLRRSRKIMVVTGAGISTSLGIPDFRSQGTGFYAKVRELGYECGEDVFHIVNFDENPGIFYSLAGDILPNGDQYTPTHAFIRMLQDNDRLSTCYTQNIDNVEALAGIDKKRLIQCHGSFATATCRKCKTTVDGHEIFDDIRAQRVPRCKACITAIATQPPAPQKRKSSKARSEWEDSDESDSAYDVPEAGVMKPDITFFGEQLSYDFYQRFLERDVKVVDLVVVIGTSLNVSPVSDLPNSLPAHVPHIYISREPIAHINFDIQLLGECDHVVFELCRRAGWELKHEMIPEGFEVETEAADDSGCRWYVKPAAREGKPAHPIDV